MSTTKSIRIILIDDHRVVHEALAAMISLVDDFELVAQGNNGEDAIDLCDQFLPDLVLMDVVMPKVDGVEATRTILSQHPNIKILGLSSFQDDISVNSMIKSGAVGYVLKNASVDELENIIRAVHEGNTVINSNLMHKIIQPDMVKMQHIPHLSPRQLEILKLVASGMSYDSIATVLDISTSTVKFHMSNILMKLQVETRNEAILVAAKNNFI